MIADGTRVEVSYTAALADGAVVDSSAMRGEPFEFTLGSGEVALGLDNAVAGMAVGEKRTVLVPAREAYGVHDDALVVSVPKSHLGVLPLLAAGALATVVIGGVRTQVRVLAVDGEQVLIDCNHPLAGCDLVYEVEVRSVAGESAVQAELHGEGCSCGCHRLKKQLNERLAS